MNMFGLGVPEVTILVMFLGGLGLPLGIPPQPENPAMSYVAPEKCLAYTTWSGLADPNPESENHTEKLLAEPEVQRFMMALNAALTKGLDHYARISGDEKAPHLQKIVPTLVKTLLTRPAAIFVQNAEWKDDKLTLSAGALLSAGEDADELVANVLELIKESGLESQPLTIAKGTFSRIPASEAAPNELTLGAVGPYVLIGIGPNAVESMLERLRAKQSPAWLTTLKDRWQVERRASLSYVNLPQIMQAVTPQLGPDGAKWIKSLGLDQVGAMEAVSGLNAEGIVSHTLIPFFGQPHGVITLFEGPGMQQEQLSFIPRDSIMASAFTFDADRLLTVIQKAVAENAPEELKQFDAALQQVELATGMKLQDDILAALGDQWTAHLAPADGLITGFTFSTTIRNRAKLVDILARTKGFLQLLSTRELQMDLRRTKTAQYDLYTVTGLPGLAPSFALDSERIVVALVPQTIRANYELLPAERGLFDMPDTLPYFQRQGKLLGIGKQDTSGFFEFSYGYFSVMASAALDAANRAARQSGGQPLPALFDMADIPSARSIHRHLRPSVSAMWRTKEGLEFETRQTVPTPNVSAVSGVGLALLLPAVQSAREAARRSQSLNNLRQIALAVHNFHDQRRRLPGAYLLDKDGKPGLSWRVMILPFLEQNALFEQFHLDEPWDSEHNKKLLDKMPAVYRSPSSRAPADHTVYLGVTGKDAVFVAPANEKAAGVTFARIIDGLSNTVGVVESSDERGVPWTKPDDFEPDATNPQAGLRGSNPGGFNVMMMDGSVRTIPHTIDPKMLLRLFNCHDGEPVKLP